jgi:hypothetical protein
MHTKPSTRRPRLARTVVGVVGAALVAVSALAFVDSCADASAYAELFGWKYWALQLVLVMPVAGIACGVAVSVTAWRQRSGWIVAGWGLLWVVSVVVMLVAGQGLRQ